MLEIIAPFIIIFCLLFAWFLFEAINKRTNFFYKWHWVILCAIPFIAFAVVCAPMIATNVTVIINICVSGSVIAFGFGFSVSCITYKYKQWRDKKLEMVKEATVFGYKSNKEQIENKKNNKGGRL